MNKTLQTIIISVAVALILAIIGGVVNNYLTVVKHDVRISDMQAQINDMSDRVDALENERK